MDKQTKNKVKSMVLALREDFEKEIANRLNNMGISPDREWKDGRSLPHLSDDEIGRNELEKRRRIAAFINREIKAGQSQKAATEEFIREASYTWVNRLLGLKCLESQDLIEEVITTRPEYGNRSKQHRDFREKNPEAASKPDDGLIGCLFSAFKARNEEIRVLFDPEDEYSLIIPRYPVLKNAIEKINTELAYEVYQADDFLGWVYQYFNSKEKDRVFEEVRTKKKKIAGNDIINATQLYTEKYMVHFLIENSLGAMWMEMYPDSPLSSRWEYFVKDPNDTTRETKQVKEIKFLDPACGSGHFLLYAFDLFYAMYEEEGIIPQEQIPEFILKNNLHGIDIDQRAIQLSALGLYMKAKSKNPSMKVQYMNLVSANAVMLNSVILEEFLRDFEDDKVAQELIKTIWKGLAGIREIGSLLRIEEQIDEVIKQQKQKGSMINFYVENNPKNWIQWKRDLLKAIREYYQKGSESFDINKQLFANEAYKGVLFLDLLENKYDVLATNPPYMTERNLELHIKSYVKNNFPLSWYDLYTIFIEVNTNLLVEDGYLSMITQSGFINLVTYSKLREHLLDNLFIRTFIHLGPNSFSEITGEVVNSSMFCFKKNKKLKEKTSIFMNLTESIDKNQSLIDSIKKGENTFGVNSKLFSELPNKCFAYYLSNDIINCILDNDLLGKYLEAKVGIVTCDNDKFLRYYWEIDQQDLDLKWFVYSKGGTFNKWYGNLEMVIYWKDNGDKIKKFVLTKYSSISRQIRNQQYYLTEGLTYTSLTSKGLGVRYLPEKCLFDTSGPIIISKKYNKYYCMGFLNSKLVSFFLDVFNKGLGISPGSLANVPYIHPPKDLETFISNQALECVNIKKSLLQFTINDREFKQTAICWGHSKLKEN